MKAVVLLIFLLIGIGIFAVNVYMGVFQDVLSFQGGQDRFSQIAEDISEDLTPREPEKEISIPPPLRILHPAPADKPAPFAQLSAQGVLNWTNTHRQQAGLALLRRNSLLDEVASAKVADMFDRQYFEHISPSGAGVADVAQEAGYEFIAIGENLALGNYASDQALVQAWMDSPGHRANILGEQYEEIGIALGQGMFPAQGGSASGGEGRSTWLAVQVFGRPLASCDFPSESLKQSIASATRQIDEFSLQLEQLRREVDAYRPKFGPGYNQRVEEYNALVQMYNSLAQNTREKINQYNLQVREFNECAKG